jgi:uncharacterized protein YecT (DUF1311 family)
MLPALVLVFALASAAGATPAPTVSPAPDRAHAPSPVPVAASAAPARVETAGRARSAAPAPAVSPAEAAVLLARAEKCLADATCTEDANALYRRADDGGAKGLSCFRFYYGLGIAKDLPRARACFERKVAGERCGDSSPDLDLDRLFLATMLIDAQGGPADPARVEPLFAGCSDDSAVSGVLAEVPKRSRPDPGREPLDFCKDVAESTLRIGQCIGVDRVRVAAERVRVERLLFPRLDRESRRLAAKARDAWTDFAQKEGHVYSDMYRGGTMSSIAGAGHRNELEKRRAAALARFFDYKPSGGADPAKAERDLDKAYHEACSSDAERTKLCTAARKAWTAYRDAEAALYLRVHGALGEKQVAADVKATLARQYQADLEDVIRP